MEYCWSRISCYRVIGSRGLYIPLHFGERDNSLKSKTSDSSSLQAERRGSLQVDHFPNTYPPPHSDTPAWQPIPFSEAMCSISKRDCALLLMFPAHYPKIRYLQWSGSILLAFIRVVQIRSQTNTTPHDVYKFLFTRMVLYDAAVRK